MMRKRLRLGAALVAGLGLMHVHAQTMYVKESGGTETPYSLSEIRKMRFSSGRLDITGAGGDDEAYILRHLRYLRFRQFTMGIGDPERGGDGGRSLTGGLNPVSNVLLVDLSGAVSPNGAVSILNLAGRVIKSREVTGTGVFSMDMAGLPEGVYVCQYKSASEARTMRIVKQW